MGAGRAALRLPAMRPVQAMHLSRWDYRHREQGSLPRVLVSVTYVGSCGSGPCPRWGRSRQCIYRGGITAIASRARSHGFWCRSPMLAPVGAGLARDGAGPGDAFIAAGTPPSRAGLAPTGSGVDHLCWLARLPCGSGPCPRWGRSRRCIYRGGITAIASRARSHGFWCRSLMLAGPLALWERALPAMGPVQAMHLSRRDYRHREQGSRPRVSARSAPETLWPLGFAGR